MIRPVIPQACFVRYEVYNSHRNGGNWRPKSAAVPGYRVGRGTRVPRPISAAVPRVPRPISAAVPSGSTNQKPRNFGGFWLVGRRGTRVPRLISAANSHLSYDWCLKMGVSKIWEIQWDSKYDLIFQFWTCLAGTVGTFRIKKSLNPLMDVCLSLSVWTCRV